MLVFFVMIFLRSSSSYLEGEGEFINLNVCQIISNVKSETIWKESPLSSIFQTCYTQFFMIVFNVRLHLLFKRKIPIKLDTYFYDLYDRLPQQQNLDKESKLRTLHLLSVKANKIMIQANLQETTGKLLTLRYVQQCCYFLSFTVKHNALQLSLLFFPNFYLCFTAFPECWFQQFFNKKNGSML